MAADSSINETDAPAAGDEKPSPLREPPGGPPRPPRPAKRASGPVRIPLPSAFTPGSRLSGTPRAESAGTAPALSSRVAPVATLLEADDVIPESKPQSAPRAESPPTSSRPGYAPSTPSPKPPSSAPTATVQEVFDASAIPTPVPTARTSTRPPPAVITPAVPGDSRTNIEFQLTRRSSAAPPLSFGSAEGSERAPAAPLTPWRDVPALNEPGETEGAPARAAQPDQDHEETIVGAVPQNLLELSSEDEEENTRAYQAPPELVDLARRQREQRRRAETVSKKRDPQRAFRDSLPPTARRLDDEDSDQSDINTATVPIPTDAAAPPVALSGPARDGASARSSGARTSNGAPSLSDLAREVSEPRLPLSLPPGGVSGSPESGASVSGYETPWFTRARIWALLVGVFIVVGYALARWRGLDLFAR